MTDYRDVVEGPPDSNPQKVLQAMTSIQMGNNQVEGGSSVDLSLYSKIGDVYTVYIQPFIC